MTTSSKLGYTAAGTTILVAALAPFLLFPLFSKGFANMGLHIDEVYSGGPKLRRIQAGAYTIDIHRQVTPHFWQTEKPFVQIDWSRAEALPSHISEAVDVDGDGQPDVQVNFDVPKDRKAKLFVNVVAMNPRYESMRNIGKQKFSSMIARVDDAIVVRIPMK